MLSYCNVADLIHTLGRIHSYRVSRRVFPLFYHQQKTGQEIPEELDSEESLDRFPFIIFLFIFRHRFKNGFWNEGRKRKPLVAMLDPWVTFTLKTASFINQSKQPLLDRCRHCLLSTRAQSCKKSDSRSTQMNLLIVSLSSFVSSPFASVSKMDKTYYDQ